MPTSHFTKSTVEVMRRVISHPAVCTDNCNGRTTQLNITEMAEEAGGEEHRLCHTGNCGPQRKVGLNANGTWHGSPPDSGSAVHPTLRLRAKKTRVKIVIHESEDTNGKVMEGSECPRSFGCYSLA